MCAETNTYNHFSHHCRFQVYFARLAYQVADTNYCLTVLIWVLNDDDVVICNLLCWSMLQAFLQMP